MLSLKNKLSDFGFESRAAGELASIAKDSALFFAAEYSEAPVTRLGGRPNLPPSAEWPVWEERPLGFVAQVELMDLPEIAGLDLPHSGALYFFYQCESAAFDVNERGMFRVLYSEHSLTGFPARDFPPGLDEEYRYTAVAIGLAAKELTMPGTEDTMLDQLGLTAREWDLYEAFEADFHQWQMAPEMPLPGYPRWMANMPEVKKNYDRERPFGVHRIGGYPDYLQHDPKFEAHLIALDLRSHVYQGGIEESTRRYEEARRDVGAGATEWELLLQVDSEQSADIVWGDVGRLYYLIRRDDLGRRDFSKVWMVFDCH